MCDPQARFTQECLLALIRLFNNNKDTVLCIFFCDTENFFNPTDGPNTRKRIRR